MVTEISHSVGHAAIGGILTGGMATLNLARCFYYSRPLAILALISALVVAGYTAGLSALIRNTARQLAMGQGHLFGLQVQLVIGIEIGSDEERLIGKKVVGIASIALDPGIEPAVAAFDGFEKHGPLASLDPTARRRTDVDVDLSVTVERAEPNRVDEHTITAGQSDVDPIEAAWQFRRDLGAVSVRPSRQDAFAAASRVFARTPKWQARPRSRFGSRPAGGTYSRKVSPPFAP
jgi:hypothetical protein